MKPKPAPPAPRKPRKPTVTDFQSVLEDFAPDPRNTILVFPLDADGEPTEEALRQFAAIVNAADKEQ